MYKNSLSYTFKICTLYVCYLHLNFLKWNLKKIHNERKNKLESLHQNTNSFNKSERQSHFEKYIKLSFHPGFSFLKLKVKSLSHVRLFVTSCTIAYEAPPSMEFSFLTFPKSLCVRQWLRCKRFFATPWTIAHQAPLSMGFSGQEYWVFLGFHFLLQGIFPPRTEPRSPALQADSLPSEPPGKPQSVWTWQPVILTAPFCSTPRYPRTSQLSPAGCCAVSVRHVWLVVTPWTAARPAPLCTEILQARMLEWVPVPSSRDLPNPGIEPRSPTLQADVKGRELKNDSVFPLD